MSSLQTILDEARRNDLKVALLWFGAWKNSMSCYTPEWFKIDTKRFPRAHTAIGKQVEEASALSRNVLDADSRALCKVMEYLRDNDNGHAVVMLQVENEIGMVESPRDHSADATKMYKSRVPAELVQYLNANYDNLHPYIKQRVSYPVKEGTWSQIFGDDMYGEEIFQTWTYAKYAGEMAKRAKQVYDIPAFVNVALNSRGRKPGEYPSGGPLDHLIDLWHCGAPDIDVLGVDIYDKGFADWIDKYHRHNNPLFVPEIRLEDKDAMYALYAIGHHDAMGFCPFSIEDYPLYANQSSNDWRNVDVSADDQINAFAAQGQRLSPIAATYRMLGGAMDLITARQGTDDLDAVLLDNDKREATIETPDGVRMTVKHSLSLGWEPKPADGIWPEAAVMVIRLGKMEYLVIGSNVVLTFSPVESGQQWQSADKRIGIAKCEEVELADGEMTILRHLNGDQTHQGRHIRIPANQYSAQHFKLYKY